jgi:hypothetical protein
MRLAFGSLILVLGFAGGCAVQSSTKPVEYLDERTAATVAALKNPLQFTPSTSPGVADRPVGVGSRISFAYLGPVEWDKAGSYQYGLWMHVVGNSSWTPTDIRSPSAVTLVLDDDSVVLVPMDDPHLGHAAYQPVASWGQTTYFSLSVKLIQRMAASHKLNLDVRGTDGNTVTFVADGDTQAVLGEFVRARALTGD